MIYKKDLEYWNQCQIINYDDNKICRKCTWYRISAILRVYLKRRGVNNTDLNEKKERKKNEGCYNWYRNS
jgi:hypothetical protein